MPHLGQNFGLMLFLKYALQDGHLQFFRVNMRPKKIPTNAAVYKILLDKLNNVKFGFSWRIISKITTNNIGGVT